MTSNHFDDSGHARMVDVSAKQPSRRIAVASATIAMNDAAAESVRNRGGRKGDVLAVARLAAIGASKWTQHLIPLCHAIAIESVDVAFQWSESEDRSLARAAGPEAASATVQIEAASSSHRLECRVTCSTTAKTGIEMEAMTAASIAALTVYDMLKSVDRGIVVGPVQLLHKSGGVSGSWQRETD